MLTSCLPYLGTKLQAVILTAILMALQVVSIWLRFCLILTLRYAIMSINIYWYSYHHTERATTNSPMMLGLELHSFSIGDTQ